MLICATSTADNITAVFTAVGGIAAAVAALAALWAARTSRDTARDAGQALALATKPSFSFGTMVETDGTGPLIISLHVRNNALFAATDVGMRVAPRFGRSYEASWPAIAPAPADPVNVKGGGNAVTAFVPGAQAGDTVTQIVLTYSDGGRRGRWRIVRDMVNTIDGLPTDIETQLR